MKKFEKLLLVTIAVLGLLPAALFAQEDPAVVQYYKTREAQASPNLKQILAAGRKEIADKKLTFSIGNTTVSERDIHTLYGEYKVIAADDARIKAELAQMAAEQAAILKNIKDLENVNANSPSYDPRNDNRLPAIRDQQCGDCWAYSSVGALEISDIKENHTPPANIDLSERQMVTCSGAGSCSGGWPYLVYEFLKKDKTNMMTAAQYPDNGQNGPCPNIKPDTKVELATWGIADPNAGLFKIADEKKIKEAIVKYGSVSACVNVTSLFQHYSGGIFNETYSDHSNPSVNHAIVLVGWNDSKKAWLLRNSWGTGWGEKGYMWINMDSNNIGFGTIWCVARK
jgi:cathepsin K